MSLSTPTPFFLLSCFHQASSTAERTPLHTPSLPRYPPPLQHPFLDLRLLTLSSEGEQLWRRIVWGINSRQRTARPPASSSQGDGGGRAVMERLHRSCLWNTVGITHSSSNSAGRGWAVPFVWEARGALTRLLSAALDQLEGGDVIGAQAPLPQLKWRGVREICVTGWGTNQHDCKHLELISGPQKMFLSL